MAIFTLIGTAIAGALGLGAAAASIVSAGLAIGARLLVGYLNRPKTRKYAAVSGTVQYGADTSAGSMFGTGKVAGQRIYYAKYGSGNVLNADVFVLSNGVCDGLEPEIYFDGKKHTLVTRTKTGNETEHWGIDGFDDDVSIKFFDGTQTEASAALVSQTASLGNNWKSTSVVAGCAYVIVTRKWSTKFKATPEFGFVLRGLKLYDPRFDDTYTGGSGDQRLDDPTTWVFTKNPAIQRLNYLLGVKGLISGRTLIGVGMPFAGIDVDSHIAAANVCDTLRTVNGDAKKTYECSLYVQGDDTHTEILSEFEDAMAGYRMNRGGLSGVIAGAPQVPVATITSADIRTDEPQQFSGKKSAFELYNVISGQFTSPESNWEAESLKTVTVSADVAADKHKRQTSNDFLQVTDPDIAQYLLNIRYRQNRKGGSASVPVSRRMGFKADLGSWVTYKDRTWLVTGRKVSAELKFTLTLSETGSDVYDEEGIEPGPIVVPPTAPVNPSLLSTVSNFNVAVGEVQGDDGYNVPALEFTWDAPDDRSITTVSIFYQVYTDETGDVAPFEVQSTDPESGSLITTANVVSGKNYAARATISTTPDRLRSYTAWKITATPTGFLTTVVDLGQLGDDVEAKLAWLGGGQRAALEALWQDVNNSAQISTAQLMDVQHEEHRVESRYGDAISYVDTSIYAATGPDSALAAQITEVEANVGDLLASGLISITANTDPPDGVYSEIDIAGRAEADGDVATTALLLQVYDDSGTLRTRMIGIADQFILRSEDGSAAENPFIFQDGVLTLAVANIGTVNAGIIQNPGGTRMIINATEGTISLFR